MTNEEKWAARTDAELIEMRDINRAKAALADQEDEHKTARKHREIAAYCQQLLTQRGRSK